MKKIFKRLITGILVFTGFISSLLSIKARQRFGRFIGNLFLILSKKRKHITLNNLRHAFPEKTHSWRRKTMKKSYHNLGVVLAEISAFKYFKEKDIREMIRFENAELINEVHSRGKGLILMSGHFGNWELLAFAGGLYSGVSITIIVKRQKNKYADRLMNSFRTMANNKVVSMYKTAHVVVKTLLQKGAIALLADQSADPKKDIYVDFFGRSVPTFDSPAVLALKFNVPIVMGFAVRGNDGVYSVRLMEIKHDDLEYSREGVEKLTQRHVKILEDAVRQRPWMWVWQHRRWKHTLKAEETENHA